MASSSAPAGKVSNKGPRGKGSGYQLVHQDDEEERGGEGAQQEQEPKQRYGTNLAAAHFGAANMMTRRRSERPYRTLVLILSVFVVLLLASNLYLTLPYAFTGSSSGCAPPKVPQYFQTSPQLWAGPTATGKPAFMAQTRAFDPTATYAPNEPLQTSIPIEGMEQGNQSIFKMMGFLSPYAPSPGFGVDEYPIPEGADIVQVQMLSRHGSRYPTGGSEVAVLGEKIANASGKLVAKDSLAFLNDWKYQLGYEILVPKGRQELFDSGKQACPRKKGHGGRVV